MQLIFQDPYSSLNPRMTVMQIISEPLVLHGVARGQELEDRVRQLVRQVGLDTKYLNRYPHAFSGGQRQRIGIARALVLHPSIVIADEAVSALDMSVQAQILNLLKDLQGKLNLTYLFIAHDLSVIRHFSDRVLVMYAGKLVEQGQTADIFSRPRHPYTESLISAAPKADPSAKSQRIILRDEVPDPANLPPGCPFHLRCRFANDRCRSEVPALRTVFDHHRAACHWSGQLELTGVGEQT
jgi:peptide/nickel transport system ATP-binding protein